MEQTLVDFLNRHPIVTLSLLIAAGTFLGQLRIGEISLGASAVLFVGMMLGHFHVHLPDVIGTLGLVLFVYSVGLQAGPTFLKNLRQHGRSFLQLATVILSSAFLTALGLGLLFRFSAALTTGVYSGSMTSTPSLASALEVMADPTVSVGYGIGYPFGLVCLIAFVYLAPRLVGVNLREEATRVEQANKPTPVQVVWYLIENPLIEGKKLEEITTEHLTHAQISRVAKEGVTLPARGELVLARGDYLRAVGTAKELERLEVLIGRPVPQYEEPPSRITVATLVVTEPAVVGKRLAELNFRERYGVNVTRLWRDDLEFVPTGKTTLAYGDTIRVVGDPADCDRLISVVGHQVKRLQETQFFPLALALLAGVLLAQVPFSLPIGLTLKLGIAGGVLFAGLLAGHLGGIGAMSFRVPMAARQFIRELGLILFLGNAGLHAGEQFLAVVQREGLLLCVMAVILRTVPMVVGFVFAFRVLRWDVLTCLGGICGALTCTAGLGVVSKLSDSDVPSRAYVIVYPTALIGVTLLAPMLGLLLQRALAQG